MGPRDSDKTHRDQNELVEADEELEEEEAYDDLFAPPVVNSEMADAADSVRGARGEEQVAEVEPELSYSDRRLYSGAIPPPPAPRHSKYMTGGGDTEDAPDDEAPPPIDDDDDEILLPGSHSWSQADGEGPSTLGAAPPPAARAPVDDETWVVADGPPPSSLEGDD